MKRLSLYPLLVGLMACFLLSCSKTLSFDLPMAYSRQAAVFVATENSSVISYHAETGNKLWEVSTSGVVEATPAFYIFKQFAYPDKQILYVITKTGYLYAIDVLEGKIIWSNATGILLANGLTVYENRIYISADQLYCRNINNGGGTWAYNGSGPCTSAPQVLGGRAYVAVGAQIHSVDVSNGNGVWQSAGTPAPIESSVRVSNATIYFGCTDGKVYAINEWDGSPKWNYSAGDKVQAAPIVYGGMCLVGSDDYSLHCIDTTTGLKRWTYPTKERVRSSAFIHPSTESVLVGSYDFNLYCIDHVSGTLRWKYPAASLIKSSPVIMDNYVYFTSFDRYMYCVNILNGSLVWKKFMNGNAQGSPVVDDLLNGIHAGDSGASPY